MVRVLPFIAVTATALQLPGVLRPAPHAVARSTLLRMEDTDFDLVIVGCGVGGHGAALHAVSKGLKVAVCAGGDVGGTCVNRGCVPSKALLAASGRVRAMQDDKHLAALGISVGGEVTYEREKVAAHANNLASTVKKNLGNSLTGLGVTVFEESGKLIDGKTVSLGGGKTLKADNVILATGSVPFVPPGVQTDGKTVFTSDEALKLEWVPDWIVIVGSGYIGLEFSDVYTALGSEVTFVEAMPRLMAFFDKQIAQQADKILIRPRNIDGYTNVFASEVPLDSPYPPHTPTHPPTHSHRHHAAPSQHPVALHHVASSPSRRVPVTTPHPRHHAASSPPPPPPLLSMHPPLPR